MPRTFKIFLFTVGFVCAAMFPPYPWNALVLAAGVLGICIGFYQMTKRDVQRFSNRFWSALEDRGNKDDPDPDFIPYATTRYRRVK